MNDQRKAASEMLEMLGCPPPHSEEEIDRIINQVTKYFTDNEIPSVEAAKYRAEHGSLGFFAGLQEIVNEVKAKRN